MNQNNRAGALRSIPESIVPGTNEWMIASALNQISNENRRKYPIDGFIMYDGGSENKREYHTKPEYSRQNKRSNDWESLLCWARERKEARKKLRVQRIKNTLIAGLSVLGTWTLPIVTEYYTQTAQKTLGTVLQAMPHQEKGRFWEGIHTLETQTNKIKGEEAGLQFPDWGVLPDVTVIGAYPLSSDNRVRVRTKDGEIIYEKEPTQIYLKEIPEAVKKALVLREDAEFYEHAGINWRGKIGAVVSTLKGKKRGGSSITEQLAKQIKLDRGETPVRSSLEGLIRKGVDMIGALEIDARYEKEEILGFYANYMYFGNENYGVEKAAQDYFGKSAERLKFNEAVFLACLLNDPSNNPKTKEGFKIQWEDYTREIQKLKEKEKISGQEAEKYLAKGAIRIKHEKEGKEKTSPYATAVNTVLGYGLKNQYDVNMRAVIDWSERFYNVDILTTIDPTATRAAQKAIESKKFPANGEPSIVVLDDEQQIVAIISGKQKQTLSKATSMNNRAIESKIDLASTIKPLYYAYAAENDIVGLDTVFDETTDRTYNGKLWPRNGDGRYDRKMTARSALIISNNRIAVKVYEKIVKKREGLILQKSGFEMLQTFYASLGLEMHDFQDETEMAYALGIQTATALELASAYNIFFNEAAPCKPKIIERVSLGKNKIMGMEETCDGKRPEIDNEEVEEVLEDIAARNKVTHYNGRIGLKTGTSNYTMVARIAGFYEHKGREYAFAFDVDGQNKSLGEPSASKVVGPIAREYFRSL